MMTDYRFSWCCRCGKIFSNFIYERLSKIPLRQHKLMVRVFESLKTPDNTKRYRSFEDLYSQLNIKKTKRLKALLHRLSGFDILRQEGRKGTHWYEFKHDYVIDEINRWLKERRERINRKRLLYAILPGIILFIVLFTYAFIQYNTFYAEFSIPQYEFQAEEIIITRGFNPFNERITTGYFRDEFKVYTNSGIVMNYGDIKDYGTVRKLKDRIKISSWDKNNWKSLAETLSKAKSGEFLYKIGYKKLGLKVLIKELKKNEFWSQASGSLVRLGKADKTVIEVLIIALKDKDYYLRFKVADTLVRLGKADKTVINELIPALKDYNEDLRKNVAESLGSMGKADKIVIEALLLTLKDKDSYVRQMATDSLENFLQKKSETELIELLKHPLSEYRTAAAYALKHKKSLSPGTIDEINQLKDKDPRPWVRLGAWKAFELLQEKKEEEQKEDLGE